MRVLAGQLYTVLKLRIGIAIAVTALAGLAVTPGAAPPGWQVLLLGLAVLFSSASAGAFNHYVERDLDARMARTRNRPFVTGVFRPGLPWLWTIGAMLVLSVGSVALFINATVALHTFLGAFFYGVVYTVWLKRRTPLNIVLGGLAGSFAVLAGASAINPSIPPEPLWLAIVLFLWTPPHFWSLAIVLHKDYEAGGVPMLPVVIGDARAARIILAHTVAVVIASLVPALFYSLGWIYLLSAIVGGTWFILRSIQLVQRPDPASARANFRASLGQLSLLLAGCIFDPVLLG